jgi:hypothetical protein
MNKRTNPLITEDPPDRTALTTRPSTWAADLISHRSVQLAIALWVAGIVAVVLIVHGSLPFNRPSFAGESIVSQVLNQQAQLLEELGLIALIVFLTRQRRIPDIASRAPVVSVSRREVLGMVAYAVGVQALGYALGRALGYYPISLHLPGTLYGLAGALPPSEVYLWAGYNFVAYAVLPYVFFRSRGYSNEALNLKSSNFWADVRLIAVVLIIESALELAFNHRIFSLTGHQLLLGIPAAFVIYFVGTTLPVMVFIYAILLPRYLRLTGSVVATVILGGVTYAALHVFEAWGAYNSPTNWLLTLIFVGFQYFGPGMVKSALTVRTGNAWVHVWAYHAIAPHVWADTPVIVDALSIH